MSESNSCEFCLNYEYDEDCECYVCGVDLDMDEFERFTTGAVADCPFFRINNEYKIVEKQN